MQRVFPKKFDILVLALIYLAALSVNLTKAVQIDDTAYLEMAQAIIQDPLHPLSQTINWGSTQQPISTVNQPPLLSYVLALVMIVGGDSGFVLHLSWSVFTLAAIIAFYMLARLTKSNALFLTGLFALSPGFLPGQNLMFDVPLIALWTLFFWAILSAHGDKTRQRYFLAACFITIALFVKYTSLVLLCVFVIVIIYRRHWKPLWLLLIPLGALILWSIFNYFDYGGIHVLDRNIDQNKPGFWLLDRLIASIAGLGLISPFAVIFILQKRPGLAEKAMLSSATLLSFGVFCLAIYDKLPKTAALLWAMYCFAGGLSLLFIPYCIYKNLSVSDTEQRQPAIEQSLILSLWIVGTIVFAILFSPHITIRHTLLILPPVLLLISNYLKVKKTGVLKQVSVLVLTAVLGLTISISDAYYANIYRDAAVAIKSTLPADARIWQLGHWGWQWYSKRQGMLQYDTLTSKLSPGDYLVIPKYIDQQQIAPHDTPNLQDIKEIRIPAPPFTWIRTMYTDQFGGYYSFAFPSILPVKYSQAPFIFTIKMVIKK